MLATISFPILERIPLVGDLAISPHGIGIAVGFLLGARLMLDRVDRRGVTTRVVPEARQRTTQLLGRAAIGAIIGARLGYVITHADLYADDPLSVFAVWEGGLTFLGGLTGAILIVLPELRRLGWRPLQVLDSVAPGLTLGLVIGRIGDLVIGDHIGDPAGSFPLGWRCTANLWDRATNSFGWIPPQPYPLDAVTRGTLDPPTQGCFDIALHQTALYDFLSVVALLGVMLWLERRPRWDGFFVALYLYWYGTVRFLTDFVREDRRFGGLTGSQWALLIAAVALTAWLAQRRPWQQRPWAWDPPRFPWAAHRAAEESTADVS